MTDTWWLPLVLSVVGLMGPAVTALAWKLADFYKARALRSLELTVLVPTSLKTRFVRHCFDSGMFDGVTPVFELAERERGARVPIPSCVPLQNGQTLLGALFGSGPATSNPDARRTIVAHTVLPGFQKYPVTVELRFQRHFLLSSADRVAVRALLLRGPASPSRPVVVNAISNWIVAVSGRASSDLIAVTLQAPAGMRTSFVSPSSFPAPVLPASIFPDLVAFATRFFQPEYGDRCRSAGFPWRFGATFYGAPGNGKSMAAAALAAAVGADLVILNLEAMKRSDFDCMFASSTRPKILVLEELDCCAAACRRDGSWVTPSPISTVTTSPTSDPRTAATDGLTPGLLFSLLDGPGAPERLLTIATTNHIDRLDPAILRAGRCGDRLVEFGPPTPESLEVLFRRSLPLDGVTDVGTPEPAWFEAAASAFGASTAFRSMSAAQAFFRQFVHEPVGEDMVKNLLAQLAPPES